MKRLATAAALAILVGLLAWGLAEWTKAVGEWSRVDPDDPALDRSSRAGLLRWKRSVAGSLSRGPAALEFHKRNGNRAAAEASREKIRKLRAALEEIEERLRTAQ